MGWKDISPALRPVLTDATEWTVELELRSMPYECWRCHTVADVPLFLHLGCCTFVEDVFTIVDGPLMGYLRELLSQIDTRLAAPIKPRRSRTLATTCLSHGCPGCDALFGAFPLNDATVEIFTEGTLPRQTLVARCTRPALEWWTLNGFRSNA